MNCEELTEAAEIISEIRATIRVNLMTVNADAARALLVDGTERYIRSDTHWAQETEKPAMYEAVLAFALQLLVLNRDRCQLAKIPSDWQRARLHDANLFGRDAIRCCRRDRLNA